MKKLLLLAVTPLFLGIGLPARAQEPAKAKEELAKLLTDLKKNEGDKVQIIVALAEFGPRAEPAIPILIKALEEKNEDLRLNAAITLGKIGKASVAPLAELLGSENDDVRFYSIWALGWIGPDANETVPAIIKALGDKNPGIRRKAAYTLGRIAPRPEKVVGELIKALGDKNDEVRQATVEAISKMGRPVVPALIEALDNTDFVIRNHAAQALGEIGADAKAAVGALKKLMLAKDGAEKGTLNLAADALGKIGKDSIPALVDALKDERDVIRNVSLSALGRVGAPAVPALVDALGDKRVDVRRMAAQVLWPMRISDKMVVLGLTFALKDQDEQVRNTAYNGLQFLVQGAAQAAKPAAPHLQKFLSDPNFQTRNFAFHLLRQMGENPAEGLLKALASKDQNIKINTASVMLLNNVEANSAVPVLMEALSNKDATLRMQAAHALAQTRRETEKVIPILVEGLKNEGPSVRQQAVQALSGLGNLAKDAAPALLDALKHDDANLRQQAVQALQSIQTDPETLIPALAKVLKEDASVGVKITAIHVLSQHGGKGLTIMLDAIKDKEPGVRQQAIWALQNLGGDSATIVPVLAKLFKEDQDENVRVAVVRGLWRHGAKAVPLIIDALKDENANIRRQAVWILYRVRGADLKDALPTLKTLMKNEDANIRQGVVQVLGRIGESAIPDIIDALGDSQERVRWTAAMTLRNFGSKASKAAPILIDLAVKDKNQTVRIHSMYTVVNMGDEGVAGLLKAVKDHKDTQMWVAAMQALRAFGTRSTAAIPFLVDALDDKDNTVRLHAFQVLVNMGKAGHGGLVKGLKSHDANIRQGILQTLLNQNVRSKEAVPGLILCLKDDRPQIRWLSAQILGNIGPDAAAAVTALTAALDDANQMVRDNARKALKQIRPKE